LSWRTLRSSLMVGAVTVGAGFDGIGFDCTPATSMKAAARSPVRGEGGERKERSEERKKKRCLHQFPVLAKHCCQGLLQNEVVFSQDDLNRDAAAAAGSRGLDGARRTRAQKGKGIGT
jgi:hypothetical protein